ncbi:unnamed protein product [Coregonus sp. 'balchen']|nr:unnamed protein product [Coregonus sp. 'balchen']
MKAGLWCGVVWCGGLPLKDFSDCLNEAIMRQFSVIIWYAPVRILFLIAGKIMEMRDVGEMGGNPYLLQALGTSSSSATLPITFRCLEETNDVDKRGERGETRGKEGRPGGKRGDQGGKGETRGKERRPGGKRGEQGEREETRGKERRPGGKRGDQGERGETRQDQKDLVPEFVLDTTATSTGAAEIPQAGLVTMVIILTSVGLPTEDITLTIAVDWFL